MTELPQAPTPPPVSGSPTEQPQGNGPAIAGMVLGIVGLVGICIWWIGLPCAILGLVFGFLGRKRAKLTRTGGGMATAGIVCSCIALGLVVVAMIFAIVGVSLADKFAEEQQAQQALLVLQSLLA